MLAKRGQTELLAFFPKRLRSGTGILSNFVLSTIVFRGILADCRILIAEVNVMNDILPAVINPVTESERMSEVEDDASTSLKPSKTPKPDRGPSFEEKKDFINSSFGNSFVHSFYTYVRRCSSVTETEMSRLREASQKYCFQPQWILEKKLSYRDKTGLSWLVYKEGYGMFCILCTKHDVPNVQKRVKNLTVNLPFVLNVRPLKNTALHYNMVSVFQKEFEEEKSKEDVYFNAFLALYWVAKEEIANTKFSSLLELVEKMGSSHLKFFQHRSGGSVREMFTPLGKMVESEVVKKAQRASYMGLLINEVMDIAQMRRPVLFIRYVDPDTHEVKTYFLAVNDIYESSSSANAETIKSLVVKQLSDCDPDIKK